MAEPADLLRAGTTLAVDAAAVEVSDALRSRGVRAIVLRGPAIGRLYDGSRAYDDVDLLVAAGDLPIVEQLLRETGFELTSRDVHAAPWIRRSDGMNVDVHSTLVGIHAPAEVAWRELSTQTEPLRLPRGEVEVLRPPALSLAIALHAAQHGVDGQKSLADLAHAVERVSADDWTEAAALAGRLDADAALATGLRLIPEGAALADRLGLPVVGSRELALRAGSAPPTALGFWRLSETPGIANKARLVARELAPGPAFMRAMYPVARRGPVGLALSYVFRPLALARQVGPGFLAWRRAAKASEPHR